MSAKTLPSLLLITNPENGDPEEDQYLRDVLADTFTVTLTDPKRAVTLLPSFSRCLIRNAWPSTVFRSELLAIQTMSVKRGLRLYNPTHRGPIEDKRYLATLWQEGYPVIPTIFSLAQLDTLPLQQNYIIKPLDGCSSRGVESVSREELKRKTLNHHLIQPEIEILHERSYYFIDAVFQYAMISPNKEARWDLHEFEPGEEEIAWAQKFVTWNALTYGIQRIDAAETKSGERLLMEIEDQACFLSLLDLPKTTRERFCSELKQSLLKHLCSP